MFTWIKVIGLDGSNTPHVGDADRSLGKDADGVPCAEWVRDCAALQTAIDSGAVNVVAGPVLALTGAFAEAQIVGE